MTGRPAPDLAAESAVTLPWGAWRLEEARTFEMPPSWRVVPLPMRDRRAMTAAEVAAALDAPIGAPPLEVLAGEARSISIAVDDITRPTPAAPILSALLERLAKAGVPDERITLVMASGAHRPSTTWDVEQKVGTELARRLRVVCHDPAGDLSDTGVTLAGVPVRLNRAFADADLRLGICAVLPHPFAAFSGGGKIVVPGLADLDVLVRTHKYALMGLGGGHDLARNRFRTDMEAAVRAIGLHWTVNVVVNSAREIAFVASGDLVSAHRAAATAAAEYGQTDPPGAPLDALFINAYPKDGELLQIESALVALKSGMLGWLAPGAPIVLMAACSEGLGTHGLFGPGGRLFRPPAAKGFLGGHPLVIYSPGVADDDARAAFWSGYAFYDRWSDLVAALEASLPREARAGVLPCGPLQLAARTA